MMNAVLFQYARTPQKDITKISDKKVVTLLQHSSMDIFNLNQKIDDEFSNCLYSFYHAPYLKVIPEKVKYAKKLFEQLNLLNPPFLKPLDQLNLKIFQEKNEKLSILDHEKIEINYKKLLFLVAIMNHLFKQVEKEKNLKDYLSGNIPFPQPKEEIKIGGQYYLSSLLDNFGTVKKVNLCLFKNKSPFTLEKETPFIKEAILIFEMLFSVLFEGVMELNIDLNIHPYNFKHFTADASSTNPLRIEDKYKEILIANEIIFRKLLSMKRLMRVSITMSDSYQIESYSILIKELMNSDLPQGNMMRNTTNVEAKETGSFSSRKTTTLTASSIETGKKIENILFYFNELCGRNNDLHIMEMDFHFNSLDPLLFYSINHIITKSDDLANLKISFFDFNKININKIRLNHFYFMEAYKHQKYPPNDKAQALYKKINKEQNEKNLSDLFDLFNNHLEGLIISLSYRLKNFSNLTFDFSSGDNSDCQIYLSDDYRTAIAVFLFNILICLQTYECEHKVNSFTFIMDDVNQSNKYLFTKFKEQFKEYEQGLNISNTEISLITFAIPNISLILPFRNFPTKTLTYLELKHMTLTDFSNLCDELSNNIHLFQALQVLVISFDYMQGNDEVKFKKLLKHFIEDLLVPKLENLTIEFNHFIEKSEIYDLLYYVRNSKFHNNVQGTITYEFKLNDKELVEFLVDKKQAIKTQGSFYHGLDKMNGKRKIRYEQIQHNIRYYNSLDLNIFSNNSLIAVVYGFEGVKNKKNKTKCKLENVFKTIYKFMGKTRKTKTVHFTKNF